MTITSTALSSACAANRQRLNRIIYPFLILGCVACAADIGDAASAQNQSMGTSEVITIQPGDERFDPPAFDDFEVAYNSQTSKTGVFRVQAIKSGDGKKLSLIDIIPMESNVIVAQRQIDLQSFRSDFSAQPFFAWGQDFIVGQSNAERYDWTRVPIGGGEPIRMTGDIANQGYANEMFSPTLASLMPMSVGSKFQIPEAYPRQGEFVSSEYDLYEVLRMETLELPSGISCECWVIEKSSWGGPVEHIWVAREAPFVFRRIRNVGDDRREFQSDAVSFRYLNQ